MILHVDVRWLLERQAEVLPKQPEVHDYSGLVAAVARQRVDPPKLGYTTDAAWRAATLLHTIVMLRPLPADNALYAMLCTAVYMHASGETIDPPFGAMHSLVADLRANRADVYAAAELIRAWRV